MVCYIVLFAIVAGEIAHTIFSLIAANNEEYNLWGSTGAMLQ